MITYEPLRNLLNARGMRLLELETGNGGILNKRTVSKLRNDLPMNLESIVSVCNFLKVPIEDVVKVVIDD